MSKIFATLEREAFRAGITPRTKQSREWFRKRANQIKRINRKGLMKEEPIETRPDYAAGSMFMFFYDPKHKKTLPYYDQFPLIIAVGPAEGGFYGLNLHYLPPVLRAKFLDALMGVTTNKKFNDKTRFKVTYKMLKKTAKMRYFEPCWKHYLTKHVKGNLAYIPAPEWEVAVFLPAAQWKKAKETKVYYDSRKIING